VRCLKLYIARETYPLAGLASAFPGRKQLSSAQDAAQVDRSVSRLPWLNNETMTSSSEPVALEGGGRSVVYRHGNVVLRNTGPWTPAVHALLRHLGDVGFPAAPRLVGSGLDDDGREMLTFIDGEFTHPGPWSLDGAAALGGLLRDLHQAHLVVPPGPRCGVVPLAWPRPGRPG
jgi:hypothetical protein